MLRNTDGEGCFSILIQPNTRYNTNWRVKALFTIGLTSKDTQLLERVKYSWNVGNIHRSSATSVQYRVETLRELKVIIDHFDKYPLITAKLTDYLLFKKALAIIQSREHLNIKGLLELVGIKASLNLGLPENLKEAFPK